MGKFLSTSIGKEVFVVGPEEDEVEGELMVFTELPDLLEYLISKSTGLESEIRVLHGVVTAAETIPQELDFKNIDVYILIDDNVVAEKGVIMSFEDSSAEDLAAIVEDLVLSGGMIPTLAPQNIDNIMLLYGYELYIGLAINPAEIKEDKIERCKLLNYRSVRLKQAIVKE